METTNDRSAQYFLDLIKQSRKGKFKIYIGMSARVGKTYLMLQEAHTLLKNAVDVQIAYIETHNRAETQALVAGLPQILRRKIFYKGKELEELDVQSVINAHPEVVIVVLARKRKKLPRCNGNIECRNQCDIGTEHSTFGKPESKSIANNQCRYYRACA